jgi:hypothetical protein
MHELRLASTVITTRERQVDFPLAVYCVAAALIEDYSGATGVPIGYNPHQDPQKIMSKLWLHIFASFPIIVLRPSRDSQKIWAP